MYQKEGSNITSIRCYSSSPIEYSLLEESNSDWIVFILFLCLKKIRNLGGKYTRLKGYIDPAFLQGDLTR